MHSIRARGMLKENWVMRNKFLYLCDVSYSVHFPNFPRAVSKQDIDLNLEQLFNFPEDRLSGAFFLSMFEWQISHFFFQEVIYLWN
jgi:hypothetical protein